MQRKCEHHTYHQPLTNQMPTRFGSPSHRSHTRRLVVVAGLAIPAYLLPIQLTALTRVFSDEFNHAGKV